MTKAMKKNGKEVLLNFIAVKVLFLKAKTQSRKSENMVKIYKECSRLLFSLACIIGINGCKTEGEKNTETPNETASSYYKEDYRPQFHFSPQEKWINDPNGLVYNDGVYHLFYQYYPDSTVWGPMHWGHAISKDMLKWEHKPVALYPDKHGYIFSGSAVVDKNNTSVLEPLKKLLWLRYIPIT